MQRDLVVGELRLGDHLPPARRPVHPPERRRGRAGAARSDAAGVMFTRNPITGADERVIEASWGLGEAVVAGRVIPDNFRIDRVGEVLERTPGLKKIAVRSLPDGGHGRGAGRARARRDSSASSDDELAALTRSARGARRSTARRATSSGRSPTASCTCCSAARSRGPRGWRPRGGAGF